ncbi:protein-export membrane protein SecD [Anoxybacter fermentans]|uniref:Protein translocase subunit SecD n=1 Tax=Anoxybacter fermentans TaxID=1323375 RepID=A0A3Q9HQ12_9FIRM|nr:protein translocase subunit SecD [Anoxybacter fermentans]AZR73097.1 protein-export membrane protein SecD [Anoxybacter fermentans]
MNWRRKRLLKIISILLIIGFSYFLYDYYGIRQGLDLAGGAHIVLKAQDTDKRKVDAEAMQGIINILERRINGLGLSEATIRPVKNDNRIIIELPGVDKPMEVLDIIGQTAMLEFKNEEGETVMTGEYLVKAEPAHDQFGRPVINFELNDEGTKIFREITRKNIGKRIAIYLDDQLLTNPVVQTEIVRKGQITGYSTFEEAAQHAVLLREGALPVPVTYEEIRNIDATLGKISIDQSKKAGILGLILVALFMIFWYRYPGFIATQALVIYGLIVLGVMAGLRATLTLPGIAGLILSIGMAVDANIIIFERIKEELRAGKTVRAAIDAGFRRAVTTILDANVTTLITALILAYFTSGTVRGFAVTLGIGILSSMFTAIIITRNLMDLQMKFINSPRAFGVRR